MKDDPVNQAGDFSEVMLERVPATTKKLENVSLQRTPDGRVVGFAGMKAGHEGRRSFDGLRMPLEVKAQAEQTGQM